MMIAGWTPMGRMKAKLVISTIDETRTSDGETRDTAIPLITAWAEIVPLSGRELYLARAQQQQITHVIRMHYDPDITAKMQATWQGRTFYFESVINVNEANRQLEIMAIEVKP